MQGLSWASIKKNPALIPLYVCFGMGFIGSTGYLLRLATKNPDVSWNKKSSQEPWQEYKDKQYKFYSSEDFSKYYPKPPSY